jgi:hypothetical protein
VTSDALFDMPMTALPVGEVVWREAQRREIAWLLRERHYLGPLSRDRYVYGGFVDDVAVAAQIWTLPTARFLPADGSWLELARWCLTPAAGTNAGSRMHGAVVRRLRQRDARVTTLVSYSDPSVGHTGSLYKACNWTWAPTWHRLRPPPSGNGSWDGETAQSVKDRWVFAVKRDSRRDEILRVKDESVVRQRGDESGN